MSMEPNARDFGHNQVPANIRIYVKVLGEDLAITFLIQFGGAELTMARHPQKHGALAQLVGIPLASQLAREGEHLPKRVPLAQKWVAQKLFAKGLPVTEISRRLRTTDVTVRGYVKDETKRLANFDQLRLL